MDAHAQAGESHAHVVPVRVYVAVFLSLMVLTAVTVAVAFVDLGALNNVAMLGIALTKATLVVLFFMHARYSPSLTWVVVVGAFLFMLLIVFGTLMDAVSRGWLGFPGS